MRTVIIGGGSLGLLLADASMSIGERPYLLVRRREQVEALNRQGLTVYEKGRVRSNRRDFDVSTQWPEQIGRVIVATKFDAIPSLLPTLKTIGAPVLFIQNGLAHYELVQQENLLQVTFASIEHGAARLTDASVSHNGVGRLVLPKETSQTIWKDYIHSSNIHYPVEHVEEDGLTILKKKAFMNVLINPITAIYQVPNGQLVKETMYYEKMHALYEELSTAFDELKSLVPFQSIVALCQKTSQNHSSMYQDRQKNRRNEVQTIVTPLVQEARHRGASVPLLEKYEQQLHELNDEVIS